MLDKIIEVQISELTKKRYHLRAFERQSGLDVRLVGYQELRRESTKKRKYEVVRWYDWYNNRDRHDKKFIPVEQVELPQSVKQSFITDLIEGMTFITTDGKK